MSQTFTVRRSKIQGALLQHYVTFMPRTTQLLITCWWCGSKYKAHE